MLNFIILESLKIFWRNFAKFCKFLENWLLVFNVTFGHNFGSVCVFLPKFWKVYYYFSKILQIFGKLRPLVFNLTFSHNFGSVCPFLPEFSQVYHFGKFKNSLATFCNILQTFRKLGLLVFNLTFWILIQNFVAKSNKYCFFETCHPCPEVVIKIDVLLQG